MVDDSWVREMRWYIVERIVSCIALLVTLCFNGSPTGFKRVFVGVGSFRFFADKVGLLLLRAMVESGKGRESRLNMKQGSQMWREVLGRTPQIQRFVPDPPIPRLGL